VISWGGTAPTRFDADQSHGSILDERIKHTGCIAATSHASHHGVREPTERAQALLAAFFADHALEIANHHRKGMRADDRADDVVRVPLSTGRTSAPSSRMLKTLGR
jgi:hypothetical protein